MAEGQKGRWILLVDDDDGIRDSLSELLVLAGHDVRTASNGEEAFEILRSAGTPPAAILLDMMMPVMDGYDFRASQLADPAFAAIPVLVLTAGVIDDRVRDLGADACLRKPLDVDRLLNEVAAYVSAG